jgi:hypothetical protein
LNDLSEESSGRDVMGRIYGVGMSLLQMLLLVGGVAVTGGQFETVFFSTKT